LEWTEDTNDAFESARDAKRSVIFPQPYAQKLFPFRLSSVAGGLKADKFMFRDFELGRIYNWKQGSLYFNTHHYVYHLL
jgi:hypothetical protein